MSSMSYQRRSHFSGPVSTKYAPSYSSSREPTLLEKTYQGRSSVNTSRNLGFSSTYYNSSNYSPSSYDYGTRKGRASGSELVRPSTRSRSMARESIIKKSDYARDFSVGRTSSGYPTFGNTSTYDSTSSHRPEFTTIKSPTRKKLSPTYDQNGRRTSGAGLAKETTTTTNGFSSPKIEVTRTVHQTSRISAAEFSPSYTSRNRMTNNNNNTDDSTVSSRSSSSSRRSGTSRTIDKIENFSSSPPNSLTAANAGKIGLRNIGNTCFMNSILQCLSNTRPLRDYCLNRKYENEVNTTSSPMKGKLVEAFYDLLRQLWQPTSSSGSAVSTSSFKSQIQRFSSRFSGYEQQDSQEFLRFLIEGLHEDVNRVSNKHKDQMPNYDSLGEESKARKTWDFYQSKDNSYIVDLFMGQLKSSLKCQECGHVSTTFDPFWDLSLPIPKHSRNKLDLQSCFENFTRTEILEGDERPTCDRCKARRTMTKKFTIHRFPKILVIHLKRFNEGQRFRQKLSQEVEFPRKLDITSPISTSPESYNLYAVSNHSGSCYGGHYTAYCKNPETKEWYSYNDSLVSTMSQSSVQTKEAYVLFYEMSSMRSKSHL